MRNNQNSARENDKCNTFDSITILERKIFTKWSFQQTLNKWIEVRHIYCQVKFLGKKR